MHARTKEFVTESNQGRCLDLNTGRLNNHVGTLITYNCTGGTNQQWAGLVMSDSLALALVSGANARRLDSAARAAVPADTP